MTTTLVSPKPYDPEYIASSTRSSPSAPKPSGPILIPGPPPASLPCSLVPCSSSLVPLYLRLLAFQRTLRKERIYHHAKHL